MPPRSTLADSVARFDALASPSPAGTATPGGTPVPVSPSEVEATAAGDVLLRCSTANDVELLCGQYTEYDGGCHDSIVGKPYRAVDLAAEIRARLERARGEMRKLLWGEVRGLFARVVT